MRKYVPLYEDIEREFPPEFTETDIHGAEVGVWNLGEKQVLSATMIVFHLSEMIRMGAHSVGMDVINGTPVFKFYSDMPSGLGVPTNWYQARGSLLKCKEFFSKKPGAYAISIGYDDDGTYEIYLDRTSMNENETFPAEFTETDMLPENAYLVVKIIIHEDSLINHKNSIMDAPVYGSEICIAVRDENGIGSIVYPDQEITNEISAMGHIFQLMTLRKVRKYLDDNYGIIYGENAHIQGVTSNKKRGETFIVCKWKK